MVVAAPFWGKVSDRYGRKIVVVFGFVGTMLGYVIFARVASAGIAEGTDTTKTLISVSIARAFLGFFLCAVPLSSQALMADITDAADRASGMAIIGAATGLGMILGPSLSGILIGYGVLLPIYAATSLALIGAVAAALFLPGTPSSIYRPSKHDIVFGRVLRPWLTGGTALWISVATVQLAGGFYLLDRFGLTVERAGVELAIAFTLIGAAMFFAQIFQIKILKLRAPILVVVGAALWMAGLSLVLTCATPLQFHIAYATVGLGSGFMLPGIMAGASLAVDVNGQGIASGLVSASQGAGFIVGPMVAATLYEWNSGLPFLVLIIIMAFVLTIFVPLSMRATAETRIRTIDRRDHGDLQ